MIGVTHERGGREEIRMKKLIVVCGFLVMGIILYNILSSKDKPKVHLDAVPTAHPPYVYPPATPPDPVGAELRSHIAAMNALLKDSNELVDETNEVLRLKAEGLDCDRVNLTLQMSSSLMDSYSEKAKPEAEWFDHIPKDPEIVTRLRKDKQLRGELDQLKAKRKAFYRKSMALAPRMRLCAPASEVKIWTMTIWVD